MKTKIWKLYFWILIVSGLIIYPWQTFSRFWEIIDLIIYAVALIGLYAFIWKRGIFNKLFWKAYFFIIIIWNIFYFYFLPLPEKVSEASQISPFVMSTVTVILYIPLFIALYRTGFNGKIK